MVRNKKTMQTILGKSASAKLFHIGVILLIIGVALPLVGFAIPSPLTVTPTLIVHVYDVDTEQPVQNAVVAVFSGGGGIEPPENAFATEITDVDGNAVFLISGFYRVGVYAAGYESAYDPHNPPAEWLNVWTCWGAAGVGQVIEYPFAVRNVSALPDTEQPQTTIPAEPTSIYSVGSFINFVTLAGAACIISGVFLSTKEKRRL